MNLTKRQRQVYDFIVEFQAAKGFSPSLREIKAGIGVSSVSHVHGHLEAMEERGVIHRTKGHARCITVITEGNITLEWLKSVRKEGWSLADVIDCLNGISHPMFEESHARLD